ncbi:hypothetical protein [Bacillus massiliigorillae]|uniref:hypothetical protein n=1 Tax=Bacillus massiliigorillae TaxID=1243664 RepID=UPI00039BEB2E|nr:hypothetical protein [Bacillus massiliigorillae]
MILKRNNLHHVWLALFLLVVGSNIAIYHTTLGTSILTESATGAVIGSIIDLTIVAPLLILRWKRKWNWKFTVTLMASGLIITRFVIPMEYLEPFAAVTWIGFAVEGGIVLLEVLVLVTLFKHLPAIVRKVKESSLPVVFSYAKATDEKVKSIPIIQIICSELLMFYYALASWRTKPILNESSFTVYHKSNVITFQVMLIHAIVLESLGLHWWLHNQSLLLSVILLVINIYSVIFILGDIQALRLNPLQLAEDRMYISLGLMKRMEIKYEDIEELVADSETLEKKLPKTTIDFMARDFEQITPHLILKLKRPVEATLFMGIKKQYEEVAIRVDEPERFIRMLIDKGNLNEFK